jgi:hypothetical protein
MKDLMSASDLFRLCVRREGSKRTIDLGVDHVRDPVGVGLVWRLLVL